MTHKFLILLAVTVIVSAFSPALAAESAADPWWSHVKLVADSISSILVIVGAGIGAWWAIFRYRLLESDEAHLERKRRESPAYLNTDLILKVVKNGDGFDLVGEVKGENPGNGSLVVDISPDANPENRKPVIIRRMKIGADGNYEPDGEPVVVPFLPVEEMGELTIEPKSKISLPFVAHIKEPQICHVQFKSPIVGKPDSWQAVEIIHVGIGVEEDAPQKDEDPDS